MSHILNDELKFTRRVFIRLTAVTVGLAASFEAVFFKTSAFAQASISGLPQPDEAVDATIKRLFGNRTISSGEGKIKIELPQIAEDGGNVAITVDASLPVSGATHVSHLYIVADKNRRPMLAKFSFTADSGRAFASTSIRLATTTDVRAVVEMNDGKLFAVSKNVRVTISGCDLPPQG